MHLEAGKDGSSVRAKLNELVAGCSFILLYYSYMRVVISLHVSLLPRMLILQNTKLFLSFNFLLIWLSASLFQWSSTVLI